MKQQTVEIRLELLKKIGEGLSKAETVKYLTEKFGITESGAYYHFNSKQRWIKDYADFSSVGNLQDQVFQRFNHVYREASFQYQHCQEHNGRIGYLRTMLEAAKCLREFLPNKMVEVEPKEIRLSWFDLPNMDKFADTEELAEFYAWRHTHKYPVDSSNNTRNSDSDNKQFIQEDEADENSNNSINPR